MMSKNKELYNQWFQDGADNSISIFFSLPLKVQIRILMADYNDDSIRNHFIDLREVSVSNNISKILFDILYRECYLEDREEIILKNLLNFLERIRLELFQNKNVKQNNHIINKLIPQCLFEEKYYTKDIARYKKIKRYCDGRLWHIDNNDMYCNEHYVISNHSRPCCSNYLNANNDYRITCGTYFNLYDILRKAPPFSSKTLTAVLGRSMTNNELIAKIAGTFNRTFELKERLKCRKCNNLMKFNFEYAKKYLAAYSVTLAHCDNESCEKYGKEIYLNHCINPNCRSVIDSRDSVKHPALDDRYRLCLKCGASKNHRAGQFCPSCGNENMINRPGTRLYTCSSCNHQIVVSKDNFKLPLFFGEERYSQEYECSSNLGIDNVDIIEEI